MNSIIILLTSLLITNCQEEQESKVFNNDKVIAEWTSYELTVDGETFTQQITLFNTFFTSIKFADTGYQLFPAGYRDNSSKVESNQKWEINGNSLLLFGADGKLWKTCTIEKLSDTKLWLRYEENDQNKLVKFKRI